MIQYPMMSPDGSTIVFARSVNHRAYSMGGHTWDQWEIFAIQVDGTHLRRLTSGAYSAISPPRYSPDGKVVVYSAYPRVFPGMPVTDIYTVAADGSSAPSKITTDGHSMSPVYTPNGSEILFISDAKKPFNYELWTMSPQGTRRRQITSTGWYNVNARPSADGKRALFLADQDREGRYELWEVRLTGGKPHRIAGSVLFSKPGSWRPGR